MKKTLMIICALLIGISCLTGCKNTQYDEKNEDTVVIVEDDSKYYSMNLNNEYNFETGYDNLYYIADQDQYIFSEDDKLGLLSNTGEVVLTNTYDKLLVIDANHFRVAINDEFGIISETGTVLVPLEYDYLYMEDEDNITFEKDGMYGFMNINAEVYMSYNTSNLDYTYNSYHMIKGQAIVKIGSEFVVIDKDQKIITPTFYLIYRVGDVYVCWSTFLSGGLFVYNNYIYNNEGNMITQQVFSKVYTHGENIYAEYTKDGLNHWMLFDGQGVVITQDTDEAYYNAEELKLQYCLDDYYLYNSDVAYNGDSKYTAQDNETIVNVTNDFIVVKTINGYGLRSYAGTTLLLPIYINGSATIGDISLFSFSNTETGEVDGADYLYIGSDQTGTEYAIGFQDYKSVVYYDGDTLSLTDYGVQRVNNGYMIANNSKGEGVLDMEGNTIIPLTHSNVVAIYFTNNYQF